MFCQPEAKPWGERLKRERQSGSWDHVDFKLIEFTTDLLLSSTFIFALSACLIGGKFSR